MIIDLWIMRYRYLIIMVLTALCIVGCENGKKETTEENDSDSVFVEDYFVFWRKINTIDAHNEQDTIVGNFTGRGIDTLHIDCDTTKDQYELGYFYINSSNSRIPRCDLYGINAAPPKLVNEGDLDGNGKCEVGYLPTWNTSQWRTYQIYTLVNYQWRNLVEDEYLDTPEWFRHANVEIAEKGPHKGEVLIHYAYEGVNLADTSRIIEIRDTIVRPTFSKIQW